MESGLRAQTPASPWPMFLQGQDCEGGAWGLVIPAEAVGALGQAVALSGDFYREREIYRGLTLCRGPVLAAAYSEGSSDGPWGKCAEQEEWFGQLHKGEQGQQSFQPTDTPPQLPDDGCFTVEATTLILSGEAAWIAGNRLLSFLDEDATAHIKKVNRRKFTVKAEALWQGLTCEVKVRAYLMNSGECAFEFQRVGGDCLAFNGLFRLVKQRLCPSWSEHVNTAAPPPPLPFVLDETELSTVSLLPLIEAAQHADDVSAQAEAAAALAAAAEGGRSVSELCSPGACAAISRLLKVDRFQVSCQVVRLLAKLAIAPGAEAWFFGEGILRPLLEKVWGLVTGKQLRDELAKAIRCLRSRCETELPRQATSSVLRQSAQLPSGQAPAVKGHA